MKNTNPIKILHVIDSGGLYGAEKVLLNLVSEQIRLGVKPEIASIGEKGGVLKPLEQEAIKMKLPISKFRMKPGLNLFGARRLRNYAICNGFNIYHSHGYKGNILLGFMPKRLRRLPVVATLHGYTNTGEINKMWLYELIDRIALLRMDGVVLVSEIMRHNPKFAHLDRNKCKVIENGIPVLKQKENSSCSDLINSQIAKFSQKSFIIGAVGRLSREKGFQYLVEAFSIFSTGKDCKLIILGEGGQRQFLEEKITELGLNDKVFMPGYVPNAEQYMRFFDIFVLPSVTEGLPITLLEAMREGVPVISTKAGGVVNILRNGENGLLVDHSDKHALCEAIEQVYQSETLRLKIKDKAKLEILRRYSSERMGSRYIELYRSILKRRLTPSVI